MLWISLSDWPLGHTRLDFRAVWLQEHDCKLRLVIDPAATLVLLSITHSQRRYFRRNATLLPINDSQVNKTYHAPGIFIYFVIVLLDGIQLIFITHFLVPHLWLPRHKVRLERHRFCSLFYHHHRHIRSSPTWICFHVFLKKRNISVYCAVNDNWQEPKKMRCLKRRWWI